MEEKGCISGCVENGCGCLILIFLAGWLCGIGSMNNQERQKSEPVSYSHAVEQTENVDN